MADTLTCDREQRWGPPGTSARQLRDQVFELQRLRNASVLGRLISLMVTSGRLRILGLPLVRDVSRTWWSWRMSRKVMRWLGELPVAAVGGNFFEVMDQIAAVPTASPACDAGQALHGRLEYLLLRALLEDLRMPRQRRGIARPVLLLELPPPGAEGARAAERFLVAMHQAANAPSRQSGPRVIGGPLVIAVGRPSEDLLHLLGNPPERDFRQAGHALRQNGAAVLIGCQKVALNSSRIRVPRAEPVRFPLSWRALSRLQAALVAMRKSGMSMQSEDYGRQRWHARVVVSLWIILLSVSAWLGLHEVLSSFQSHGRLGPSDAPALVTTIVALGTATGTLIGVTLTAYAKYVQARGQAESDLIRAKAELMRAEADMVRARAHIPAAETTPGDDGPASPSPPGPDAN
ncbi:hypothetical protein [Streptomyces sp. NPDC017435]|uniref:hypothetical protein n=1 Tax=Streptomyces sp. NPDC017435 TaxID=3364995 RepID=UPI0037A4C338